MGGVKDYMIGLMERGEYLMGRDDWRAGRYVGVNLKGDAKAAYELGRRDAQDEAQPKPGEP